MERVIFRKEYNPYSKRWQVLAGFPDDKANAGNICVVSMFKIGDEIWHEGYREASLDYWFRKRIIHKDTDEANEALDMVQKIYGTEFKVCEKR